MSSTKTIEMIFFFEKRVSRIELQLTLSKYHMTLIVRWHDHPRTYWFKTLSRGGDHDDHYHRLSSQRHHIPSVTDCIVRERERRKILKRRKRLRFFWSNYSHDDVTVLKFQKTRKTHLMRRLTHKYDYNRILPHIHCYKSLIDTTYIFHRSLSPSRAHIFLWMN